MANRIGDWRSKIDEIDRQLVALLNERAGYALRIGEAKYLSGMPIYQPEREEQILQNVTRGNQGPLPDTALRRLFERILDEARSLERSAGEKSTNRAGQEGEPQQ